MVKKEKRQSAPGFTKTTTSIPEAINSTKRLKNEKI